MRYHTRLHHYIPLEIKIINVAGKFGNQEIQKIREGEAIMAQIPADSQVILLDEKGKDFTSRQFAEMINTAIHQNIRRLVYVFGGPYGVSGEIRAKADKIIRLSAMTFSHQVVRILFMEQLYRAFTIIRGEPYHHE